MFLVKLLRITKKKSRSKILNIWKGEQTSHNFAMENNKNF